MTDEIREYQTPKDKLGDLGKDTDEARALRQRINDRLRRSLHPAKDEPEKPPRKAQ